MGMEDDILKDFLAESRENMELLDQQFVELESEPDNAELIKSIFRTIHTIKGTSGFFGFNTLEGIAHFAEDILSKLRDGIVAVNEKITTVLLQAVDHINAILASLEQTGKEPDELEHLDFIVELRDFAEKLETSRDTTPDQKGGSPEGTKTNETDASAQAGPEDENPTQCPAKSRKDETSGESEKTDLPGEKVSPVSGQEPKAEKPERSSSPTTYKASDMKQGFGRTPQLTESHIRVDVNLLDRLMNLAGELVLSRNRMVQIAGQLNNQELLQANQRMSLVVTEMQEQIMQTRMQPVGNVFNKFPRIVRDLARQAKKQVQLRIEGAETELDRSIIEIIKDPITHMVRNSIDHGIEKPDTRTANGKPPGGTLTMRAYHEGGQVIIEIEDDGAGIDAQIIRRKAVDKGVLGEVQAEALSDRDALLLIFQAGFSTAEQVTNISGRGVGMDVVKSNIEKLGGAVDIQSRIGRGTTVRIKIPLTLAIIPALIVNTAGQRYAIPQVNLVELFRLSDESVERNIQIVGGSEYYRLRGQILPLIRLRRVLGLKEKEPRNGLNIVVLNNGDKNFGLVVDGINDSEEIVVKPLGSHLKHIDCYAGTTLMGDGRVALILDVVGMTAALNLQSDKPMERSLSQEESIVTAEERQFILLFSVGPEEYFAIPLALVSRLDKITPDDLEMVSGQEVIQYRGRSIPVIRLENYLPISPLPEQDEYHLIVFHLNDKDIACLVSGIDDSLDMAVEVEEQMFRQEGIVGSAIINDHTTLFLDIYQIIELHDPSFFSGSCHETRVGRILLAEDSTFYRNLLSSYMVAAGYDVVVAEDGRQGWEKFKQEEIDLVITDIEMPHMDGLELTRKIRSHEVNSDVPVIAVTSLTGDSHRQRGLEAGINDYQMKLDRERVLSSVHELMDT